MFENLSRDKAKLIGTVVVVAGGLLHLWQLAQVWTFSSAGAVMFPVLVVAPWLAIGYVIDRSQAHPRLRTTTVVAGAVYLVIAGMAFSGVVNRVEVLGSPILFVVLPFMALNVALGLCWGMSRAEKRRGNESKGKKG